MTAGGDPSPRDPLWRSLWLNGNLVAAYGVWFAVGAREMDGANPQPSWPKLLIAAGYVAYWTLKANAWTLSPDNRGR